MIRSLLACAFLLAVRTPVAAQKPPAPLGDINGDAVPDFLFFRGFPAADPKSQTLLSYELGYRVQMGERVSFDLAGYYNEYRNLVAGSADAPFVEVVPNFHLVLPISAVNNGTANTYGFEVAGTWQAADWWRLTAWYSQFKVDVNAFLTPGRDPASQASLRSKWHRTPEGSDVFPVALFRALTDPKTGRPHIESLASYGLIPAPDDDTGLPVGFSRTKAPGHEVVLTGIHCAASHSTQITCRGRPLRVDGAPNQLDVEAFFRGALPLRRLRALPQFGNLDAPRNHRDRPQPSSQLQPAHLRHGRSHRELRDQPLQGRHRREASRLRRHNVTPAEQKTMDAWHERVVPAWIETRDKGYFTRPLRGLWATAPYLHNNSVPTLWRLFQPASERPKKFATGHREFDPVRVGFVEKPEKVVWELDMTQTGNRNTGHEYGTRLTDAQKWDLVEYLKTL
jgi:hypothetical protein